MAVVQIFTMNLNIQYFTDNTFIVNDTIVKRNPVKLLIDPPTPSNKFLGYPIGLYIYNLSSDNPDEKFDLWLNKNLKGVLDYQKYYQRNKLNSLKSIIIHLMNF